MKRVVAFGEIMLRLSPPDSERFFQSPELRTYFGGSEANVAVSLAHFGMQSDFVTRLPDNAIGDAAIRFLRAEGVGVAHVARGGQRIGIYFVEPGADLRPMRVVYDRAGSAFSEMSVQDAAWTSTIAGADWLHISGITPALGTGPAQCAREGVATARAAGVPVSIDLNYRPALWAAGGRDPRVTIRPIAADCDVIIGNTGAVAALLGIETSGGHDGGGARDNAGSLLHSAERVHAELGCRWVALTKRDVISASEHGWHACLYDGETGDMHQSSSYTVRVVDRVGGGDSFAAGLIYGLLMGRDAGSTLEFATAASALKLTIPGDCNRVSVEEVNDLLQSGIAT